MPTVDTTRPSTPTPTRLDLTVFGVRSATATLSGYATEHGEYETLELSFGSEAEVTLTLAGRTIDELHHLVAALAGALPAR